MSQRRREVEAWRVRVENAHRAAQLLTAERQAGTLSVEDYQTLFEAVDSEIDAALHRLVEKRWL